MTDRKPNNEEMRRIFIEAHELASDLRASAARSSGVGVTFNREDVLGLLAVTSLMAGFCIATLDRDEETRNDDDTRRL